MLNPISNHGAGPCFEGPTQRGVYFSGNGAHVIVSECTLITPKVATFGTIVVQSVFHTYSPVSYCISDTVCCDIPSNHFFIYLLLLLAQFFIPCMGKVVKTITDSLILITDTSSILPLLGKGGKAILKQI